MVRDIVGIGKPLPTRAKRILFVSSSGGVLLDLLALEPWWSRYQTTWAVVRAADTESALATRRVRWIHDVSIRRPLSFLPGLLQAWRLLREEQPDLVVSAGAGPALAFFF